MEQVHKCNIGTTGCGKTYQAITAAKRTGKPIIYINPQDENMAGFVRVDGQEEFGTIARLLKKGYFVNYVPHRDKKISLQELDVITQKLFDLQNVEMIIDETDLHGYEGMSWSPWIDVAERGRKRGVFATFLMQDPAGVSKRILRNCTQFRIFEFNEYSRPYFARLGYDVEKLHLMLLESGKYSYIIIERGNIIGCRKE